MDEPSPAPPPGTTLPIVHTVLDDDDIDTDNFSASFLDEILDNDFSYNEGFGIKSIRIDRTPALPSSDVSPLHPDC
jgi:hypothetical protein